MRTVVKKFFGIWAYDKEEKWLCEMAAKGFGLISVGFCRYEFEECETGEYQYRLEYLKELPNHPESVKYLEFIESTGAEQIGAYGKWVYLRKKTSEGDFELFSDRSSQIEHLNRIIRLVLFISLLNVLIGVFNLVLVFAANSYGNSFGFFNLILGFLVGGLSLPLFRARKKLKAEQELFE